MLSHHQTLAILEICSRERPTTMPSIAHVRSITLELPPSCIEFCPILSQYAVVGTYNLEKQDDQEAVTEEGPPKTQQRNGSLILIHVNGDDVYGF
jgi:diphthamide biosynthesis protein 7